MKSLRKLDTLEKEDEEWGNFYADYVFNLKVFIFEINQLVKKYSHREDIRNNLGEIEERLEEFYEEEKRLSEFLGAEQLEDINRRPEDIEEDINRRRSLKPKATIN
jgi:hypothetical protein